MFAVFNIVMILLVLLIAYWWANQGLFSALLHLVCVIVAGALALAFWEPIVVGFMLKGSTFDSFAWGITLAGTFAIALLVLRVALDKLAPGNVQMPAWANLTFGGIAGFFAGVLTIGMFITSVGFIQSSNEAMGFRGWSRSERSGTVTEVNSMWMPFHAWTNSFYEMLSTGALSTRTPLARYYPDLDKQVTLVRDSYNRGRGMISMPPDALDVTQVSIYDVPDDLPEFGVKAGTGIVVQISVDRAGRDWGQQLTASAAQIRMIGEPRGGDVPVIHPSGFIQYSGLHLFDDTSHYLTTESGKESGDFMLLFESPSADFVPKFLQVKGTRFAIPTPERQEIDIVGALAAAGVMGGGTVDAVVGGADISSMIRISRDIRPINVSTNMLPGGITHRDKYLTEGSATFRRGGPRPSRTLAVLGIEEPEGVRVVKVNVSRGGPADIFRFQDLPDDTEIRLVDADGSVYTPIGYIHSTPDENTIVLKPGEHTPTLADVPQLPTSGTHTLHLVFRITAGTTITGLRLGSFDVGSCNVPVPASPV